MTALTIIAIVVCGVTVLFDALLYISAETKEQATAGVVAALNLIVIACAIVALAVHLG